MVANVRVRYLQQVVNETLRCAAIAPFAAREQEVDCIIDGHMIPAGVSLSSGTCIAEVADLNIILLCQSSVW